MKNQERVYMNDTTNYIDEAVYKELLHKYNKSAITKKELADELSMSEASISAYIVKGHGIPEYRKIGNAKNGKVLFPIASVAKFLSNTIRVA